MEKENKKTELFDFLDFVEELRNKEQKKNIVEKYERLVLKGKKISGSPEKQKWYKNYLSKFNPIPEYKVPEELKSDFDWKLLFQLVASSFSSAYRIEYMDDSDKITLPELIINVSSKDTSTEKKISELWSFQILRLFEIYCEELMNLETLIVENKEEGISIFKERKNKIENFKNIIFPNRASKKEKIKLKNKNEEYIVCHYCSLQSAYNIIKSGTIYSSDLSYMNDRDELTFGTDILIEAINEIVNKTMDNEFSVWLKNQIANIKNDIEKDIVFISCFSRKKDDLNQWRAYADNGYGICIIFDFGVTLGDPGSDGFWQNDVTYLSRYDHINENDWKIFLNKIEDTFYKLFLDSINKDNEAETTESLKTLFSIPSEIKIDIRFLKNDCFKEEGEFRVISLNENNKYKIKTRVGKEYVIPFIELKLSNKENVSTIKEIVIGPSVKDFNKAKKSFELFLTENGYELSSISINSSKIPYNP